MSFLWRRLGDLGEIMVSSLRKKWLQKLALVLALPFLTYLFTGCASLQRPGSAGSSGPDIVAGSQTDYIEGGYPSPGREFLGSQQEIPSGGKEVVKPAKDIPGKIIPVSNNTWHLTSGFVPAKEQKGEEKKKETAVVAQAQPPAERKADYVVLNFDQGDIGAVVRVVAEFLGINYILDPRVTGKVTIHTTGRIPVTQLMSVLEQILAVNNLVIQRAGPIYKIVPRTDPKLLPAESFLGKRWGDRVADDVPVLQIIPLQFLPATSMQDVLKPLATSQAVFIPVAGTNTLIIIDLASSMQRLLTVVETLDVDAFETFHVKLIPLEHARTEELVSEITEIFSAMGYMVRGREMLRFIPVPRLNAVLVVNGLKELSRSIEQWISQLDRPVAKPTQQTFVYRLQNGKATNIASVLTALFPEIRGEARPEVRPPPGFPVPRRPTVPMVQPGQPAPPPLPVREGAPAPTVREAPPARPEAVLGPSPPSPTIGEGVIIVPDTDTNSLIVRISPENYPGLLETIKKLDVMPKQVLIEALIVEVSLTDDLNLGVSWALLRGVGKFKDIAAQLGVPPAIPGTPPRLPLGAPGAVLGGLSVLYTDPSRTLVLLDFLASESKLKVLSNPRILTVENKKAEINVVTEVPILRTDTDPNTNITRTSFEFKSAGVKVGLTPKINEQGFVNLEIKEELSEIGAGVPPQFLTRQASTTVMVKDGETLILGGLISDRSQHSESGIPFLRRIPLLGYLFRSSADSRSKTELLLFITPRVILNEEDARRISSEYNQRLEYLQKIIRESPRD